MKLKMWFISFTPYETSVGQCNIRYISSLPVNFLYSTSSHTLHDDPPRPTKQTINSYGKVREGAPRYTLRQTLTQTPSVIRVVRANERLSSKVLVT